MVAVVEAKREENPLGDEVKKQAEDLLFRHRRGMAYGLRSLFL